MGFLNNLFGKKQPDATPGKPESAIGMNNPFTSDAVVKGEMIQFKCPTCPNTVSVALQQIDLIIGVSVLCPRCKNVAHVPGVYKTTPSSPGMKISGSVRVPISQFSDWFYAHPYITALIKSGQSELLYDYGLWGFCAACYHQFPATVLWSVSIAQRAGGFVFGAQTPESARDMNALIAGHCSHCQHRELIVVAAEIPDYVRDVILKKKST